MKRCIAAGRDGACILGNCMYSTLVASCFPFSPVHDSAFPFVQAAKPTKVASSRTSVRLASKHSPSRHLAPRRIASPVAQVRFTAQHEQQTDSSTRRLSQSIGIQTDFAGDAGCSANPLMQTQGRHPLLSANPAKALAEGTRLLLATSRPAAGTMTRRQQALVGLHDSSASAKAAPWTLLTQASMQLKLRTPVATTATQTEDAVQSDVLPVSSMAAQPETNSCHCKHVNRLMMASAHGLSQSDDAAHSFTSNTSAHRRSQTQSGPQHLTGCCQAAAQPAATASTFPKKQADPAVQAATKPAARSAASSAAIPASNAVKVQVQQQAQASAAADAACMPLCLASLGGAIANSPRMSPTRDFAGSPQACPARAVANSPRPQTRSSNMQRGQASDSASNKAKKRDSDRAMKIAAARASDRPMHVDSDRAKQVVKPPRRAIATSPLHSLSPNFRFMFQRQGEPLPALAPSLLRSLPPNSDLKSQPQGEPLSATVTPTDGQRKQTRELLVTLDVVLHDNYAHVFTSSAAFTRAHFHSKTQQSSTQALQGRRDSMWQMRAQLAHVNLGSFSAPVDVHARVSVYAYLSIMCRCTR